MQQEYCTENETFEIDILKIFKALWRKLWLILLVAAVFGGSLFAYQKAIYVPKYKTVITMYATVPSSEEIVSIDYLTGTCSAVLKTQSTLEAIIDAGDLDIPPAVLSTRLNLAAVSKSPMFKITVFGFTPEEVTHLANVVGETLPGQVYSVYKNCEVGVVDPPTTPTAPFNGDNAIETAVPAAAMGAAMVCAIIVIREILADWIAEKKKNKKNAQ